MKRDPGIYVEIFIQAGVEEVWRLTQDPALHQRWDLRFTHIDYLPRPDPALPQSFLYETRIGLGLSVKGTGMTTGELSTRDGTTSSALSFASADPKSLILNGSGYWCYEPRKDSLKFLTWYDYSVRFGWAGRKFDRLLFRPLMGWATAWSFDRLRLWAESGQSPESSLRFAQMHAVARLTIAFVWIWHGLVPKLIFHQFDEQIMLKNAGISTALLPWLGAGEILFGIAIVVTWEWRGIFLLNLLLMLSALLAVGLQSPAYLWAAFNPVTLNVSMMALSLVGFIAAKQMPSASACERVKGRRA